MKRRIERAPLPDPVTIRRLLSEMTSELRDGAVLIDGDAQGASGVDLLMVDQAGVPLFVDIMSEDPECVPARVFEHLAWIEENKRLFLKAYAGDGVQQDGLPEIMFVAGHFPRGVIRSLEVLQHIPIRLFRAEYLTVDGEGELLLEQVAATEAARAGDGRARTRPAAKAPTATARPSSADSGAATSRPASVSESSREAVAAEAGEPRSATSNDEAGDSEEPASPENSEPSRPSAAGTPTGETPPSVHASEGRGNGHAAAEARPAAGDADRTVGRGSASNLEDAIESEQVLGLLRLFRSGVDGLDARIVEDRSDGCVSFQLEGRQLASVCATASSFTVTPGNQTANPIVVSDRVSLERALNAVVSLFVREEQWVAPASSKKASMDEAERAELVGIWGGGLAGADS